MSLGVQMKLGYPSNGAEIAPAVIDFERETLMQTAIYQPLSSTGLRQTVAF